MTKTPKSPSVAQTREDRLKAALKANLGRRKAQARARAATDDTADTSTDHTDQKERP